MPRLNQLCEPKIENLRVTVTRHHDVVGLQIAMHHSRSMRFRQTFGHVLQVTQELWQISLLMMDQVA